MCFSATASFSASIVLTVIGIASIQKTNHKSQLLFASIPFFFGVQQFAEGILWITIDKPSYIVLQTFATYIYLFFAHVLWPLWVPIAFLLFEKTNTRKNTQKVLVFIGVMTSSYLAFCLLRYNVKASIEGHHINYLLGYSHLVNYFLIFSYGLATIAPPFFSHIKRMWILGITVFVSYAITKYFYDQNILSVWCFFSSIISVLIYYFVIKISRKHQIKID